jgi:UDP-N-acetylmuramate--alanine ligase
VKHKIRNIHFIGIGGVGMCGIAQVLARLGYNVSGSDSVISNNTNLLRENGVKIYIGHNTSNIINADVVVSSTAISSDNPEIIAAKKNNITIVPRAMMLAELMRFKYGIAIAGTHGKTTTTSLCAEVLAQCGFDPTFLIGGKLAVTGSNAKLGDGEYLIAEADESDASFLYLNPLMSVVTNIDLDHMATYDYDEDKLKQTFIEFLHKLPFYGVAILCNEDKRLREIMPKINRKIIKYGFSEESDIYAKDIKAIDGKMCFNVCVRDSLTQYPIVLNLPGIHNVLNALAVIAVALECEGEIELIKKGLEHFHGVGRRCEQYGLHKLEGISYSIIDDYGHHPVELKATLNGLKLAYPNRRLFLIFQPHRYSRTKDLFDDFVNVLSSMQDLIILDTYSAGEEFIPMADGRTLFKAIKNNGIKNAHFVERIEDVPQLLKSLIEDDDIVITMGAGNIGQLPNILIKYN